MHAQTAMLCGPLPVVQAVEFHAASGRSERSENRNIYLPSPEDIAAACLEFQAGWSLNERLRRARGITFEPGRFGDDE